MIAALRNQRQELLAQIENLKFVKNTNEKQEPETVTPVEEKQDTSSVISFEVRQDESETKSNVKTSVEESKEVTENSLRVLIQIQGKTIFRVSIHSMITG